MFLGGNFKFRLITFLMYIIDFIYVHLFVYWQHPLCPNIGIFYLCSILMKANIKLLWFTSFCVSTCYNQFILGAAITYLRILRCNKTIFSVKALFRVNHRPTQLALESFRSIIDIVLMSTILNRKNTKELRVNDEKIGLT